MRQQGIIEASKYISLRISLFVKDLTLGSEDQIRIISSVDVLLN